jgi:hypothetical protein
MEDELEQQQIGERRKTRRKRLEKRLKSCSFISRTSMNYWKVRILCISQFQQCPFPHRRELAISGKKMVMSPPKGKMNCAKAPPLGKQIGSISPPHGNIDCLAHVVCM